MEHKCLLHSLELLEVKSKEYLLINFECELKPDNDFVNLRYPYLNYKTTLSENRDRVRNVTFSHSGGS
jgi:hypothetical protein